MRCRQHPLYSGFRAAFGFSIAVLVRISHGDDDNMSGEGEKPNRIIDLGAVTQVAARDGIWAMRGKAIAAYSVLEQALAGLFCALMRTPMDRGSIVFFKITSTQTRNAIFDKLLRKEHGATYSLFWNSYLLQMRAIDTRRNEIVHWATANNIDAAADPPTVRVTLVPPAFWANLPDSPSLDFDDLYAFGVKCDVYARLCSMFFVVTGDQAQLMPPERRQAWLDIFQQPLVYPLPAGHLLNQP